MDQTINMELSKDQAILELIALLKQNQRKDAANDVFEMAAYIDGMDKKLDAVMAELVTLKKQLNEMQEKEEKKSLKAALSKAAEKLEQQCHNMKQRLFKIKTEVKTKATEIVMEVKQEGKRALKKISEFLGVKDKLELLRFNVQEAICGVDKTITKINAFGVGLREASQMAANTFRTFADKEDVDYSQKKKKFSKTEVIKKPWLSKQKLLNSLELHLDAAIDKLDNLSKDVEIIHMEKNPVTHTKVEVVSSGFNQMASEKTYLYGGDIFEAFQRQNPMNMQSTTALTSVSVPMKESKSR